MSGFLHTALFLRFIRVASLITFPCYHWVFHRVAGPHLVYPLLSSGDGRGGSFRVLAAVHICTCVFVWTCVYIFHGKILRSRTAVLYDKLTSNLGHWPVVFWSGCDYFPSCQQCLRGPVSQPFPMFLQPSQWAWSGVWFWFQFAFPWWLVVLSIFAQCSY